jgi:hypothetical protein
MTEEEWLAAADPKRLLDFLRWKASERKLRLALCGALNLFSSSVVADWIMGSRVVAENHADGLLSNRELNTFRSGLPVPAVGDQEAWRRRYFSGLLLCPKKKLFSSCEALLAYAVRARISVHAGPVWVWQKHRETRIALLKRERPIIVQFLRDIFGNPFRPLTFAAEWRTDTALSLTRGMYESRDFSAMPILADALQDAGCDNEDILSHCRGDGPHVRGCWVVDLVLGKE